MRTTTATQAKNRLGEILETVQVTPVAIEKNGRRVAVVLSGEDYDSLVMGAPGKRSKQNQRKYRFSFSASGASTRTDIAARHEDILWSPIKWFAATPTTCIGDVSGRYGIPVSAGGQK